MKYSFSLICCIFLSSFLVNAQENTPKKSLPTSIYFFNLQKDINGFTSLNNRLKLTEISFVLTNREDIDNGRFSVNFSDIGKKPSTFIYDDYKNYQKNNLLKGFFRKHDLTRWTPNELRLE